MWARAEGASSEIHSIPRASPPTNTDPTHQCCARLGLRRVSANYSKCRKAYCESVSASAARSRSSDRKTPRPAFPTTRGSSSRARSEIHPCRSTVPSRCRLRQANAHACAAPIDDRSESRDVAAASQARRGPRSIPTHSAGMESPVSSGLPRAPAIASQRCGRDASRSHDRRSSIDVHRWCQHRASAPPTAVPVASQTPLTTNRRRKTTEKKLRWRMSLVRRASIRGRDAPHLPQKQARICPSLQSNAGKRIVPKWQSSPRQHSPGPTARSAKCDESLNESARRLAGRRNPGALRFEISDGLRRCGNAQCPTHDAHCRGRL